MRYSGAAVLHLGLFALLAGCVSVERTPAPAAAPLSSEGREFVERLRIDSDWHPVATGGDCVSSWYDLPPGAYIAQGWWYSACLWGWNSCGAPVAGCWDPCRRSSHSGRGYGFRDWRSR